MSLIFEINDLPDNENWEFKVAEPAKQFTLDPAEGALTRDVEVTGTFVKTNQDFRVSGHIRSQVQLFCSRCLEPFPFEIESRFSCSCIPRPVDTLLDSEVELKAEDIEIEYYEDNKINLAQLVYDQIMLSLPVLRLCSEDCKGFCPQCGTNLNIAKCDCEGGEDVDPRFAVLKSLKDKLK